MYSVYRIGEINRHGVFSHEGCGMYFSEGGIMEQRIVLNGHLHLERGFGILNLLDTYNDAHVVENGSIVEEIEQFHFRSRHVLLLNVPSWWNGYRQVAVFDFVLG